MATRRPWLLTVGGVVVATAAVVTAFALVSRDTPADVPGPATKTSTAAEPIPSESSSAPSQPTSTGVYYVGETPAGLRLYREAFDAPDNDPLGAALALVATPPQDPDYRTLWPSGSFADVSFDGDGNDGQYTVTLAYADLNERLEGMSETEASLAIQAVIFTLHSVGGNQAPVQFAFDGNPITTVFGVPTAEPLANDPVLKTLSHIVLDSPAEGAEITGTTLKVAGLANSFEANVLVRLQRYEGTEVIAQTSFTAEGWMGEQLFPFSGEIDLTDVPAGKYILMVSTDDPSGGEEGPGAFTDTRVFTIS